MTWRAIVLVAALATTAHAHTGVLPGEAYTFRFAVGPIEGARARMSVGLPVTQDGHSLVAVQGEAETISIAKLFAPISAAYVLKLDASTLLPREVTSSETGLHNRTFHAQFGGPRGVDARELDIEVKSTQRNATVHHHLAREARDPLSAYFALRSLPLTPDSHIVLDVLDGAALWHVRLTVAGREDITLGTDTEHPRPPVHAIRLDGQLDRIFDSARPAPRVPRPSRTISLWLSDDTARVLYQARFDSELGRALLELTSYVQPSSHVRAFSPLRGLPPGITIE